MIGAALLLEAAMPSIIGAYIISCATFALLIWVASWLQGRLYEIESRLDEIKKLLEKRQ